MKTPKSVELLRKKRLFLFLPLLVLPFMTMGFWAMGGGRMKMNTKTVHSEGLNTNLPGAKFSETENQDKMSIYESFAQEQKANKIHQQDFESFAMTSQEDISAPEYQVNEKLNQLTSALSRQESPSFTGYDKSAKYSERSTGSVSRLENLMATMSGSDNDPEMKQLDAVLEKIMDIQHPGRTREKMEQRGGATGGSYAVNVLNNQNKELFNLTQKAAGITETDGNTIQATIHQDQEIVAGSVIKLRLLDSIIINEMLIPKNQLVYGVAKINEERLQIELQTIRYKSAIIPVSLSVFDLDGMEGLYIPGALGRDASKKGVDDAIQSLQIMTMDPSISTQVAGAGVQAAKGLFSKKVKLIRVKVKAGYQLLLRDNNQKNL